VVSWLGLWAHELHRVPRLLGLTPDGDLFMVLIAAALAFWWTRSHSPRAILMLTIYAAVNLAGAMVTVLPFGWLPFAPEQSVSHYAAHVIYALCQLPLLAVGGSLLLSRLASYRRVSLARSHRAAPGRAEGRHSDVGQGHE
jgi:hypothetical protein